MEVVGVYEYEIGRASGSHSTEIMSFHFFFSFCYYLLFIFLDFFQNFSKIFQDFFRKKNYKNQRVKLFLIKVIGFNGYDRVNKIKRLMMGSKVNIIDQVNGGGARTPSSNRVDVRILAWGKWHRFVRL